MSGSRDHERRPGGVCGRRDGPHRLARVVGQPGPHHVPALLIAIGQLFAQPSRSTAYPEAPAAE